MRNGCPDCLVTRMYSDLHEEITDELQTIAVRKSYAAEGEPYSWQWTIDKLLSDVGVIATMDARMDHKGYDMAWSVPARNLLMTYRQERATLTRARDRERAAALDAELKRK